MNNEYESNLTYNKFYSRKLKYEQIKLKTCDESLLYNNLMMIVQLGMKIGKNLGEIKKIRGECEKITGYEQKYLEESNISILLPGDDLKYNHNQFLTNYIETGTPHFTKNRINSIFLINKKGNLVWVNSIIRPLIINDEFNMVSYMRLIDDSEKSTVITNQKGLILVASQKFNEKIGINWFASRKIFLQNLMPSISEYFKNKNINKNFYSEMKMDLKKDSLSQKKSNTKIPKDFSGAILGLDDKNSNSSSSLKNKSFVVSFKVQTFQSELKIINYKIFEFNSIREYDETEQGNDSNPYSNFHFNKTIVDKNKNKNISSKSLDKTYFSLPSLSNVTIENNLKSFNMEFSQYENPFLIENIKNKKNNEIKEEGYLFKSRENFEKSKLIGNNETFEESKNNQHDNRKIEGFDEIKDQGESEEGENEEEYEYEYEYEDENEGKVRGKEQIFEESYGQSLEENLEEMEESLVNYTKTNKEDSTLKYLEEHNKKKKEEKGGKKKAEDYINENINEDNNGENKEDQDDESKEDNNEYNYKDSKNRDSINEDQDDQEDEEEEDNEEENEKENYGNSDSDEILDKNIKKFNNFNLKYNAQDLASSVNAGMNGLNLIKTIYEVIENGHIPQPFYKFYWMSKLLPIYIVISIVIFAISSRLYFNNMIFSIKNQNIYYEFSNEVKNI